MESKENINNFSTTPEQNEIIDNSVESALSTIENTEQYITENTGVNGSELNDLVDEALVYVAEETIRSAGTEGQRNVSELDDISKAVKAVVVQGALEQIGTKKSNSKNPILDIEKIDDGKELTTAIRELNAEDAKLPTGERVAEVAVEVIEQEKHQIIPETLYRGERVYLNNIDEIGKRSLSTTGFERTSNQDGRVYLCSDKGYAESYSVGTDGKQKWYDGPLTKEEIPIGVIYEIDNSNNSLGVIPDGEPIPDIGSEHDGEYREYTSDSVPADKYKILELQIMDDYVQPNGHTRSDFRSILERFPVDDPSKLPGVVEAIKKRINELDAIRNENTPQ